jgi:Ala-tRNA(Pro) deacylase
MIVREFLASKEVPFEVIEHHPTYDAQHMAQEVHESGYHVAKTVLLRLNGGYKYAVAVLPAADSIDLAELSHELEGVNVELATEPELARRCPDCELGALPPFGSAYNLETIVDESLSHEEDIVFEGNRHDETIRMKYRDYHQLEHPLVTSFARRPSKGRLHAAAR